MGVSSRWLFCDKGDVERRLSAEGVLLRLDHDDDGTVSVAEEAGMADALSDAAETILYYCWAKYDPTVLQQSAWINRRAVDFATYVLCGTRGNPIPDSVSKRAREAEKKLLEIRDGPGLVPACPLRRRMAPAWSNTRLDPRFSFKVIRVDPQTSSQASGLVPQVTDWQAAYTIEI